MATLLACACWLILAAQTAAAEESPAGYRDHKRVLIYCDAEGREHPVRTADDWAIRRRHILRGMQEAMGPLPNRAKWPPLDVRKLQDIEVDGVVRQTLSISADGQDRIPAYLFLPKDLRAGERRAAVLALHPTSPLGKDVVAGLGTRTNRNYAIELAQRGYIVLAPDYLSFGDYKQYDFAADDYVSGTMKGIANHMRCVDVLVAREDVDPARIGAIGHSLGGHNAMFVGVFDERIKAIVSSCGWTPFHDYYSGKLDGWTSDRYMPRIRDVYKLDPDLVPFDFYEVVAAMAPRAFFSCSPTRDENFDVAGVRKAIPVAAEVYELLGSRDALQVRYPDSEHDFPEDVRHEAYRFLDRVLKHTPTPMN